jgi:hypothetical protein
LECTFVGNPLSGELRKFLDPFTSGRSAACFSATRFNLGLTIDPQRPGNERRGRPRFGRWSWRRTACFQERSDAQQTRASAAEARVFSDRAASIVNQRLKRSFNPFVGTYT